MATKFVSRCMTPKCAKRVKTASGKTKCVQKLPKSKQVKVCFKRKEATPAQKAAKVRRAKKALREFACKASGAPAEACASRKLKR